MLISFDELFARHQIRSKFVLHLGGNEGQEAEAYQKHGVERVVWVEALPTVYPKLVRNLSRYPGHIALCACLSDENGKDVMFNVASNDGQSSSFLPFGTHTKEHPTVKFTSQIKLKTVRTDTLLKEKKITIPAGGFLNIDLQGAELLALKGMGELVGLFDHAYIEINVRELYKGCPMVEEIDRFMAGFGFNRKQTCMTGSGWGDAYYGRISAFAKSHDDSFE